MEEMSNENRRREPHFLVYPLSQFGNQSFFLQSLQNYFIFVKCLPERSAGYVAPSLLLWFNPSQQLSTMQPLPPPRSQWGGEDNQEKKSKTPALR